MLTARASRRERERGGPHPPKWKPTITSSPCYPKRTQTKSTSKSSSTSTGNGYARRGHGAARLTLAPPPKTNPNQKYKHKHKHKRKQSPPDLGAAGGDVVPEVLVAHRVAPVRQPGVALVGLWCFWCVLWVWRVWVWWFWCVYGKKGKVDGWQRVPHTHVTYRSSSVRSVRPVQEKTPHATQRNARTRTEQPVVDDDALPRRCRLLAGGGGGGGGEKVGLVRQEHAGDPPRDVVGEELLPGVDRLQAGWGCVCVVCVLCFVWVGGKRGRGPCMCVYAMHIHTITPPAPLAAADVEDEEDAGHLAEEEGVVALRGAELRVRRVPEVQVHLLVFGVGGCVLFISKNPPTQVRIGASKSMGTKKKKESDGTYAPARPPPAPLRRFPRRCRRSTGGRRRRRRRWGRTQALRGVSR